MSFENYSPKMVAGRVLQSESQRIFVRDESKNSILLPDDISIPLSFFDGTKTIQQIGQDLYQRNNKVQLKSLFQSLKCLSELGLLENEEEFKANFEKNAKITERPLPFFFRPFFTKPFAGPFQEDKGFPIPFYILSCAFALAGFYLAFLFWPSSLPDNWLRIEGSYHKGFVLVWLVHSAVLSFQGILQSILTFFGGGLFPGLELAVSPFGIYLKTSEAGDALQRSLPHRIIYLLTSLSAPLLGVSLVIAFMRSDEIMHHLAVLFPAYLLVLLDPYRTSQLSHFFVEISGNKLSADLLPYLKKRSLVALTRNREKIHNEWVLISFSTVAIIWSFLSYDFLTQLTDKNIPNLLAAIFYEGGLQTVFASIIFIILAGFSTYLIFEILSTLFVNIIQPVLNPILKLIRKKKLKKEPLSEEQIHEAIHRTHLFHSLGPTFLKRIVDLAEPQRYEAGAHIIIQGDDADNIFVIAAGNAAVEKRLHTGLVRRFTTLSIGAVIGEAALLEDGKREADVIALESTVVLKLPRNAFDSAQDEENYKTLIGRIMVSQYASQSEIFRDLPVEATSLITSLGEVEEYEPGHNVIERASFSKDFYLLLRGEVEVMHKDESIASIEEGGFFGEVALIADVPRTAKVTTRSQTTLLKLSAESFWGILSQHVNLALYLETVADIRMAEIEGSHA